MANEEHEETRGNEVMKPQVEVLPPEGERTGQPRKPVMPIGAAGPAPAEVNPGSSSTASVAQAPERQEKAIAVDVGRSRSRQQHAFGNLANRILLGALAGVVGTAAMTGAMRALHRRLAPDERYPLPPREITERVLPESTTEQTLRTSTIASHFGYGAGMGALYALATSRNKTLTGAGYGVLVWAVSYLGWIPSAGILKNAVRHPLRRNLLMSGVHLVWGAAMALTLRELDRAQAEVFFQGEPRDAPSDEGPDTAPSGSQSPTSCSTV